MNETFEFTLNNPLTDWEYGYTCGIERAESEIECAPTVDAVPVIRCKDCKWYYGDYCGGFGDGAFTPEYGFCHNAERKEE